MNPLFDISVSLYFRIRNSEWYGGVGSVGYSSVKYKHILNLDALPDALTDAMVEEKRLETALLCGVSKADVDVITYEEYENESGEEEQDD